MHHARNCKACSRRERRRPVPAGRGAGATLAAALLGLLIFTGCDDDPTPKGQFNLTGGASQTSSDTGDDPAGTQAGSGADDAPDAGDAQSEDAGLPDLSSGCAAVGDLVMPVSPRSDPGARYDLLVNGVDVLLARLEPACPADDALGRRLVLETGATPLSDGVQAASLEGASSAQLCARRQSLSALQHLDPVSGVLVTDLLHFRRGAGGSWLLAQDRLEGDAGAPAAPLLEAEGAGAWPPGLLRATTARQRALLVWSEPSSAGDESTVRTRLLTSAGRGRSVLLASEGHEVVSLAAAPHDAGSSAAALIGWVAVGEQRGVYLQALDDNGSAVDSPQRLSTLTNRSGSVAIAQGRDGAAVVYAVLTGSGQSEVRFRSIDDEGQASPAERSIAGGADKALSPAIAATPSGYVIAYRRIPPGASGEATLRLTYTDGQGNTARTRDVAPIEASGGPILVRAASDGRLVLAWSATDEEGERLHVITTQCL